MQTYLVSYDISNNGLRLKSAKLLLRAGCYRIQYSVFMGTLRSSVLNRLHKELRQLEKDKRWLSTNSIMLFPLHQYTKDSLLVIGKMPADWSLINQELLTLVL